MRLNSELVRSIMLFIEESLTALNTTISNEELTSFADKNEYSIDEINYHLWQLDNAGFLNVNFSFNYDETCSVDIKIITWKGHQFLDTIRDPKIWKDTKSIASKLESISVTVLSNIGTTVLEHFIGKQLGY